MSSSQQPIYWDSLGHTLLAATAYRVNLPVGTTDWTVMNMSGGTIGVAGTAASIVVAANVIQVPTATPPVSGNGQSLFVGNATAGPLPVLVVWRRAGRQPTSDAGTTTLTAL